MTKFNTIANILAAVRCLNSGQTIDQVAVSAKVKPATVRAWLRRGGFRQNQALGRYSI